MLKNKKNLGVFLTICLLCVALILTATVSLQINGQDKQTAFAAESTTLSAGENLVSPSSDFNQIGSPVESSIDTESVKFRSGSGSDAGYYFEGNVPKVTDGLSAAIFDSGADVTFAFKLKLELENKSQSARVAIKVQLYKSNTLLSNAFDVNVNLSNDIYGGSYTTFEIDNARIRELLVGITSSTYAGDLTFKVTVTTQSQNVIILSDPAFGVKVILSETYSQSTTFSTQRTLGVVYNNVASTDSEKVYLKSKDNIVLNTTIYKNGNSISGDPTPYYSNIFGDGKGNNIVWENFHYKADSGNLPESGSLMTATAENRGYKVTFSVSELGTDITKLAVRGNFYNKIDFNGEKTGELNEEIKFSVDTISQNQPKLAEDSAFYKAIKDGGYYTESNAVNFDLHYDSVYPSISKESVYALAVKKVGDSSVDLEYILTNILSATKIRYVDDDGSEHRVPFAFPIETHGGIYELLIVNIDDAGNVSGITKQLVRLDSSSYNFSLNAKLNNDNLQSISDYATIKSMFNVYLLVGDAYHNESGVYNGGTNILGAGNINSNIKRNQHVTIRIELTTTQLEQYLIYAFAIGNLITFDKQYIDQHIKTDGSKKYFTATIQFDQDRITSSAENQSLVTCREILTLDITKNTFVYDAQGTESYKAEHVTAKKKNGDIVTGNLKYSFLYRNDSDSAYSESRREHVGTYQYKIEVTSANEQYYGVKESSFEITKADPVFNNLRADSNIQYRPQEYYAIDDLITKRGFDNLSLISNSGSGMLDTISGKYILKSSIGVEGYFNVVSPIQGSHNYLYPRAGKQSITVQFVPTDSFSASYQAKEYTIEVRVDNAHVEVEYDTETFSHIYNGEEKVPKIKFFFRLPSISDDAILDLLDLDVKYEYKLFGTSDSEYSTIKPRNADKYDLRITVNSDTTNYQGTFLPQTLEEPLHFVINQRRLIVKLADDVLDIYSYGQLDKLNATSWIDESNTKIMQYKYSYRLTTEEKFSVPSETLPIELLAIGTYIIRTEIDDYNHSGFIDKELAIVSVNQTNNQSQILSQLPKPEQQAKYNNKHIEYLQMLKDVKFSADEYYVEYTFVGNNIKKIVGRFIFANENSALDPGLQNVKLQFQAGHYENAIFIPNHNYSVFEYDMQIDIERCNINFAKLNEDGIYTLKGLTYEDKLSSTSPVGNVIAYGSVVPGTLTILGDLNSIFDIGTHNVSCTFVPNDVTRFFVASDFALKLAVAPKEITIALKGADETKTVSRIYGTVFENPLVTINGIDNYGIGITYRYYRIVNGNEMLIDNMNHLTDSGIYIVKLSPTSSNYAGTAEVHYLKINKATFAPPTTIIIDKVRFGRLLKDINLPLMNLSHSINSAVLVFGSLKFVSYYDYTQDRFVDYNDTLKLNKIGKNLAKLKFVPADDNNYEDMIFEFEFDVEKSLLTSFSIDNLTTTYSENLTYPVAKVYDVSGGLVTDVLFIYTYSYKADGSPIVGQPKNAGIYTVEVTIDSSNYEGKTRATFTVSKQAGSLEVSDSNKVIKYTGAYLDIGYLTKPLEGLKVNILYRNYNGIDLPKESNSLTNRPTNVGKYFALMTISDINYEGSSIVEFIIIPQSVNVTNLNQDYLSNKDLVIETVPSSSKLQISPMYRTFGTTDSYRTQRPTKAGSFQVKLMLTENGIIDYPIDTIDGKIIKYTITKAKTKIICNPSYTNIYSQRAPKIDASAEQVGVALKYQYKVRGSSAGYSDEVPMDVGFYDVRIYADNNDFEGEAFTQLEITKANLDMVSAPYVSNNLSFTSPSSIATFGGGEVRFPTTGYLVAGSYIILTDISTKYVGSHSVEIEFTPNDSKNFNSIRGKFINITITQMDISSWLTFGETEFNESYNTLQHSVTAKLKEGNILPPNYILNQITVLYNGNASLPIERGEYRLSADVSDINFKGHIEGAVLHISACNPIIVAPRLGNVKRGATLSTSMIEGGNAYIMVNGKVVNVPGIFTFNEPDRVMQFINNQTVSMTFTPSDVKGNYATVTFTPQVFVIGNMFKSTDFTINISTIIYGQMLGDIEILEATATTNLAADGTVSDTPITIAGTFAWKKSNLGTIYNVGDKGTFTFIPSEEFKADYNIFEGEIDLKIDQSEIEYDAANSEAIGIVGKRYSETELKLALTNKKDGTKINIPTADIHFTNEDGTYTSVNDAVTLSIRISNKNFAEFTFTINASIFINTGANIVLTNSTVPYSGKPITTADLGVKLADTELGTDAFIFEEIFYNGVATNQILNAGTYHIKIKLFKNDNNAIYAGSKEFDITVDKLNIENDIIITSASKFVYGANIHLTFGFGDYNAVANDYTLIYYAENSQTPFYTVPSDAGNYSVKLVFKTTSVNFVGSKDFTLIIEKRFVDITLKPLVTPWKSSGLDVTIAKEINPIFDGVVFSQSDYKITYNDGNVAVPENHGIFSIEVTITHTNFFGNKSTTLTITQAKLMTDKTPTLSSIVYGQALKNSKIIGGEVRSADGINIIEGVYAFRKDYADRVDLNAGSGNDVIVVFYPTNTNYEPLEIVVNIIIIRASASISFILSQKEYTGEVLYPDFIITPSILSTKEVTINVYDKDGSIKPSINVGTYRVVITINSSNYQGSAELSEFKITQANANLDRLVKPKATDVPYKSSLADSALEFGKAFYLDKEVAGTFRYRDKGIIPSDKGIATGGIYKAIVEFVPNDANGNYAIFTTEVDVKIVKAYQELKITGKTIFIYGETVVQPTFNVESRLLQCTGKISFEQMKTVGSYQMKAEIVDDNYYGSLDFVMEVQKKKLDVKFVLGNNPTDAYYTKYNIQLDAKAKVFNGIVGSDNPIDIEKIFTYSYYLRGIDNPSISNVAPFNVGEYYCQLTLKDVNYELNTAILRIEYNIERTKITSMQFDASSLISLYGAVSKPIVSTIPTKVNYKIEFSGYQFVPKDAGKYTVKASIVDANYEPMSITSDFLIQKREITIENIVAQNKAFDGTSTIRATGTLEGVMFGDQVGLELTAKTKGDKVDPGEYEVELVTYTLTGLNKDNYNLLSPLFSTKVKITSKVVIDSETGSYISTPDGFLASISFSARESYSKQNGTNVISRLFGQQAVSFSISIKEYGFYKELDSPVKFYIKIPDKYLHEKNLKVVALNGLSDRPINFIREGDYITFYADASGEIIFEVNNFPYWTIIVGGILIIIFLGLMFMYILNPMKKRKKVPAQVRKEYLMNEAHKQVIMKKINEEQGQKNNKRR